MTLEPLSLTWFAVWAAAVGVLAVDVGKTRVFAKPRQWLDPGKPKPPELGSASYGRIKRDQSDYQIWQIRHWLYNLVYCPWCLTHWLATAVCLAYGLWNPLWWLTLTGASAVPMCVYCSLLWLLEDERLTCD